jgi:hypothetical protein
MKKLALLLLCCAEPAAAAVAVLATTAQAGTIYTNQALFDAAVTMPLSWSENFEGFTTGALPVGALSIGAGQAEIFTDGPQEIYLQTDTGNQAYWNVEVPGDPTFLAPPTIIRGPGSSSLSLSALSFNYNMGGVGNDTYVASFLSSAGLIATFLFETSVSYPNGEGGQDVPLFLGWVGAPGEFLQQVTLNPRATGILVDNINAHVVPTPAALPLFGTGLAGLAWLVRRRRRGRISHRTYYLRAVGLRGR